MSHRKGRKEFFSSRGVSEECIGILRARRCCCANGLRAFLTGCCALLRARIGRCAMLGSGCQHGGRCSSSVHFHGSPGADRSWLGSKVSKQSRQRCRNQRRRITYVLGFRVHRCPTYLGRGVSREFAPFGGSGTTIALCNDILFVRGSPATYTALIPAAGAPRNPAAGFCYVSRLKAASSK